MLGATSTAGSGRRNPLSGVRFVDPRQRQACRREFFHGARAIAQLGSHHAAHEQAPGGRRTPGKRGIEIIPRIVETGTPVAEAIRRMRTSEQSFYRWKRVYRELAIGELRGLKLLEEENRKLKQLALLRQTLNDAAAAEILSRLIESVTIYPNGPNGPEAEIIAKWAAAGLIDTRLGYIGLIL